MLPYTLNPKPYAALNPMLLVNGPIPTPPTPTDCGAESFNNQRQRPSPPTAIPEPGRFAPERATSCEADEKQDA
jgi:hypothetical protein